MNRNSIFVLSTFLFLLTSFPNVSVGHHSRVEFANEVVEIEGIITRVEWRNPHIALFLDVENETGETESWRIEAFGSPDDFESAGVTRDMYKIGDKLIVAGQLSRLRPARMLGINALLANGTETIMGELYGPRWNGPYVGGASNYSTPSPQVVDAAAEDLGVFRVWSITVRPESEYGGVEFEEDFPFSDEALASRNEWSPIDNVITRCEQPGMPLVLLQPMIFQFIRAGSDIIFYTEYFDTRRTIHMDESLNPEDQPASSLGFSIGRWEGNTLVIHTTRINYPYFQTDGTRQSEEVEVIEKYTLSEDQARLDFHLTIVDPYTFTKPATHQKYVLALGQPWRIYDCNVF